MDTLKYSATHEWVKIQGKTAWIGITDYAQHSLGSIVFVDLPTVGKVIAKEGVFGVVESVKAASDLYLPVSGTIAEVNTALTQKPELLNENAEGTFIVKVTLSNPKELDGLMTKAQYEAMAK